MNNQDKLSIFKAHSMASN